MKMILISRPIEVAPGSGIDLRASVAALANPTATTVLTTNITPEKFTCSALTIIGTAVT